MAELSATKRAPATAYRLAILVAVAIATRLITLGNPILYTDEEFYFAAGRAMIDGALPFVDIWDRKPIGVFLLYAVPGALPFAAGIWLYQAMALACAATTALIVARLADVAGWTRGGTLAGIAYLVWITIAGGQGGQTPVFYNLAMALAVWLIVDRRGAMFWRGAVAMLLVGLAIQIKYTVALEGMYLGLWLMFDDWRRTRETPVPKIGARKIGAVLGRGAVLAGLAVLPTIVAVAAYVHLDALAAFTFANFASIFARKADPIAAELANLAKAAAILLPLLAMAAAGLATAKSPTSPAERIAGSRGFLTGWLLAALLTFALLPPWTDHYTLPVMLPASVIAAGLLAHPRGRVVGIVLILIAAVAGQASLVIDRQRRGTPAQFAALVGAVGRGPGCLYVYSSSSMVYPATGRCAVSRYVFPSHLTRTRETGAIGVDQGAELARIFTRAPEIVVMGPTYDGERPDIRAAAVARLARDYRLAAQMPLGRKRVAVYRRRTPSTPGYRLRFD
ncbi:MULTISPECIES: hypothetical protein [unclassified Sphingomonas]|uniref:hypothetical protein n=1 Tax=unclassified Sphingomonas TaxID=196159 RepID=UPI0006F1FA5D|nr:MULTISPECIES: hypothetical protein [unclassified Sphingomonas]KQS48538.1 hypothetical protein ASG20_14715 [Sphingomonas sp. Leaf198]